MGGGKTRLTLLVGSCDRDVIDLRDPERRVGGIEPVKIHCACGAVIADTTDALPHKAHVVPDQEWHAVLDAIRAAVEGAAATPDGRRLNWARACTVLSNAARLAWQCRDCGRLYLDDHDNQAHEFIPGSADAPVEIFRSRPLVPLSPSAQADPQGP